jgi:hypothetical protein
MSRRVLAAACGVVLLGALDASAQVADPLGEARLLYNQQKFDAAIGAAEQARLTPSNSDGADLIAARAYLERFRESGATDDLTNARERLRRLDPARFNPQERVEFVVGLGETLFFDQSFGAAADVFQAALDGGDSLAADSRERVLDWWGSAIDREAKLRPETERPALYDRVRARMQAELSIRPASGTSAYWLAAAARGKGDLDAAWSAAEAGWVRATLASDHGEALRADLDRLMQRGIIPERARMTTQSADNLRLEWEKFKDRWKRP